MRRLAILIAVATGAYFLFSRLVFAPVPWPDGSAFYLPALDLFHWPVLWRMHAQAAFVPSYDEANFNLMPALSIVLGVGAKLSGLSHLLGAPLAIRAISILALLAYAYLLWDWASVELVARFPVGKARFIAAAIGIAALWDPTLRWGTLVVRTETWIGLGWVLILREAGRGVGNNSERELGQDVGENSAHAANYSGPSLWKISLVTALMAYFHFEAAYFVPAIALAVWAAPNREWAERLWGISWRTVVLLCPWLMYVLAHAGLFVAQMDVQFHRLEHGNHWVSNAYLLFHSLFLWLGSPAGTPKFFNVAKALTWALIIALTLELAGLRGEKTPARRPIFFAAGLAFWICFYLWCTKPEVWFITLCHLALWPWLLLAVVQAAESGRARTLQFMTAITAAIALLSVTATVVQQSQIPDYYSWQSYRAWVDCLDRGIQSVATGQKVWQTHTPDVLVELAERHPEYDLTRALDFENRRRDAERFGAEKADTIIFSRSFDVPAGETALVYDGPERAHDRELLGATEDSPFGEWALQERGPGKALAGFGFRTCHVGPFWAELALRGYRAEGNTRE